MNIPTDLLKDKKIVLGVTGSIAVYKSLELSRLFIKAGADVRVIMSESAKKFVTPLTFETLTSNQVLDDTNESWVSDHNHIKTAEWADIFIIAPATANTIAKLANGIADNILLQSTLAYSAHKIIAPSANTNMLYNPITQKNLELLKSIDYSVVDTQVKELACKTTGDGAMAEPLEVFYSTARELLKDEFWLQRAVTVTGGGTIEKIDDVRYISNFSSGKMASSLATALYCRGADVKLISTKFEPNLPGNITKIAVESTKSMFESLQETLLNSKDRETNKKSPYLIMAAAVSDYIPKDVQDGKLKKDSIGEEWNLKLTKNIDILATIDKKGIKSIGFKAEMDAKSAELNATNMLKNKNLDAVCLNILNDSSSFGTDENSIEFITEGSVISLAKTDKLSISFEILQNAKKI